jgi:hypothetical protein
MEHGLIGRFAPSARATGRIAALPVFEARRLRRSAITAAFAVVITGRIAF